MSELLEVLMLLAFGAAWPVAIMKSLKMRSTKGKSLIFLLIVMFGYICGIGSKFAGGRVNYVVLFYFINLIAVGIDAALYLRNRRLDQLAESGLKKGE